MTKLGEALIEGLTEAISMKKLMDENEQLRARIAELKAALKQFADIEPYIDSRDGQPVYAFTERMSKAARAALEKKND